MIKKVDKYLLKNFIRSFSLGLVSFLIIFTMRELFKIIGYITEGRINIWQGIQLLLHSFPAVIIEVSPLAILLGGLMSVNKMASSLEIIALKTSGISFRRVVTAPIILSLLLSLFLVWFNNNVVPSSNEAKRKFKYSEVYNVEESRIKQNVYMKGKGNYLYYIKIVNGKTKRISNLQILEMNDDLSKLLRIITAKQGKYNSEHNMWLLQEVNIVNLIENEDYKLSTFRPKFMVETPDDMLRKKVREEELTTDELKENIAFIKRTGGDVKKLLVTMYKVTAYPFACFVMCFIGLSLGSRYVRSSSAVSIGISVVIGYAYYVIMSTLEAMGVGGIVSPILGAWIPNLLFLSIGIIAMRNAEF